MEVIRPGDTVIIGRKLPDFLLEMCSCGLQCTTVHSTGTCKTNDKLVAQWAAKGESAAEYWAKLLPGVNIVWMTEPHFRDYQIIAVFRADPQPKPPPDDQIWD